MARPKGQPKLGGRQKGALNKLSRGSKESIEFVFQELGGAEAMLTWVRADEAHLSIFYEKIYPKLLPLHINAAVSGDLTIKIMQFSGNNAAK